MVRSSEMVLAVIAQASVAHVRPVLAAIAVVTTTVAAGGLAWLHHGTRPRRPRAGTATMDLPDEPPALVALLLGGFEVTNDAAVATLVDLAARRHLSIEEVAGGNVIVRLRSERAGEDLTPYERRVLDHVRARAVDGVAPAAALTTGEEAAAARWFRRFRHDVYRHGRDLGLCRRRWDLPHIVAAWVLVAAGWGTALLASSFTTGSDDVVGVPTAANLVLGMCFVALVGLTWVAGRLTRSDTHRDTAAGLEAASAWAGVEEYFGDQESFGEAPAASVIIWDRTLAYATAMGLTPIVQRQLPFETEDDRLAWSRATGGWRRVKVRYWSPRPGWGEHPLKLVVVGVIQGALAGLLAWGGWQLASEGLEVDELTGDQLRWLGLAGLAVASLAAMAVLWAAAKVVLGMVDLFPRRTVEGDLLRRRELRRGHRLPRWVQWLVWERKDLQRQLRTVRSGRLPSAANRHRHQQGHRGDARRRRCYLAVDDGNETTLTAYRVRPTIHRSLAQGGRVRLRVSPILGYVAKAEQLAPPPADPAAATHGLVEELADRVAETAPGWANVMSTQLAAVAQMADGLTDAQGRRLLDVAGRDGVTPRQRMEAARQNLARDGTRPAASPAAAPPAPAPPERPTAPTAPAAPSAPPERPTAPLSPAPPSPAPPSPADAAPASPPPPPVESSPAPSSDQHTPRPPAPPTQWPPPPPS